MKAILPLAGLAAAVAFVAYKSSKGEEPVAKAKDSPKTSSDLSADDQLYADMMKAGADADAKAKADADAKAKADADAKAKADADAKAKADADAKAKAAFDKCLITAKFLVSTPFVYQTAFPSVKGQSIGNWMILLLTSSAATKKDFQSWLVTLKSEFDNRSKVSPDATAKAIYDMGECLALEYQKRFGGT